MDIFNGDLFTNYISPLSTWIGLATFLASIYISLIITFGRRWRFKKWKRDALSSKTDRPAALVVDMVGKGAVLAAKKYILEKFGPKTDVPIIEFIHPEHGQVGVQISADDMPKLVDSFKMELNELSNTGADRVLLFISAPMPITAIVAAELANFGGVVLMHWNNQDGVYENWGPLRYH